MRSIHKHKYYDMMYNPLLPNTLIRETISFIFHYTIHYFILFMRQEPNPLVGNPVTLKT